MDQALPTQFPDLQTLFQHMPAIAAGQVGTQQRFAEQNNRSLQDAFTANQAYETQMRPLKMEHQRETTRQTGATADYQSALAKGKNIDNEFESGVLPEKLNAGKSEARLKALEAEGLLYGQAAARLKTVPPMFRAQVFKQLLGDRYNDSPELDNLLSQNVNQLPDYLQKMSERSYEAHKAAMKEGLDRSGDLTKQESRQKHEQQLLRMQIDAGRFEKSQGGAGGGGAVRTPGQQLLRENDPIKKLQLLNQLIVESQSSGDEEKAGLYTEMARLVEPAARQLIAAKGAGAQVVTQQPGAAPKLTPKGENIQSLPVAGKKEEAPAPVQYIPGQVYKGKTGTYKYNGGDKKNPASWTKVE